MSPRYRYVFSIQVCRPDAGINGSLLGTKSHLRYKLLVLFPTGRGSSVGMVSASQASGPAIDHRVPLILSWKNNFPLPLIQEELVDSNCRKNGHLILVNQSTVRLDLTRFHTA